MKHTKGNWSAREYIGHTQASSPLRPVFYLHVCDKPHPAGHIIAKCMHKDKDVLKANAKLISSAPELLKALQDIMKTMDVEVDNLDKNSVASLTSYVIGDNKIDKALCDGIRAIKKATL